MKQNNVVLIAPVTRTGKHSVDLDLRGLLRALLQAEIDNGRGSVTVEEFARRLTQP